MKSKTDKIALQSFDKDELERLFEYMTQECNKEKNYISKTGRLLDLTINIIAAIIGQVSYSKEMLAEGIEVAARQLKRNCELTFNSKEKEAKNEDD